MTTDTAGQLREALDRAVRLLETIDAGVDRDHDAQVTRETWLREVRPEVVRLRALAAEPSGPIEPACEAESTFGPCILRRGHGGTHLDAERTVFTYKRLPAPSPADSPEREGLRAALSGLDDLQRAIFEVRQFEGRAWVPVAEAARLHEAHQREMLRRIALENAASPDTGVADGAGLDALEPDAAALHSANVMCEHKTLGCLDCMTPGAPTSPVNDLNASIRIGGTSQR